MKQNELTGMYDVTVINSRLETLMGLCQQITILSTARRESSTTYIAELPPL